MATLALAAAGAAAGSALLPTGVGLLGATISGATIGSQIGALAGSYVDHALFGSSGQTQALKAPTAAELQVTASTEGAHIPRIYGQARLGGQVIWATKHEFDLVTNTAGGGKGIGGGGGSAAKSSKYVYYANFAVGICEGPISGLGRVWADNKLLDLSQVTHRFCNGSESQVPDSLIAAREGANLAPAFRGLAYIVFERLPIAAYGHRLPQLAFEVYRTVDAGTASIKAVVVIPASGEFVYATQPIARTFGAGQSQPENVHTLQGPTDWSVSLDQLAATLPTVASVSLTVAWFGTDLRAGACQLRPGVESMDKMTSPLTWAAGGVDRLGAHLISRLNGASSYGGTPADVTVVQAIQDLRARGRSVTLTPFILMDIGPGNALPSPYGGLNQPVFPWRGRITVAPAAGQPGSADKSAAAAAQIAAFVGTAGPQHFSLDGAGGVAYGGPDEWSLRRMVLHQAYLAVAAGGVDGFVIGSELRGLSTVRDQAASYPFVPALKALARDVKSVLGAGTKVTYAADWTEYFGHQPADGSGDVHFHLDPLWADPAIDAIGIDAYWPLSDWREGTAHLDILAGARSIYDLGYLSGNVQAGEDFDWYYASASDRAGQVRTAITDGQGKPWVFRAKDIGSWWRNRHYDRPGGVESASPTAWLPQSKPFWIMEVGCPAVDRGANQPNVFVDPKSSETALPYFSKGQRDDLIQRRYVQAFTAAFDPASKYYRGANPTSAVYGGPMVALDRIHVYCWDARPYPAFPGDSAVWGDSANWQLGHWLNGRMASAPLGEAVRQILDDSGFSAHDTGGLDGVVGGYVIERVMSARQALQPLELAYFFDSIETGGRIAFRHRGAAMPVLDLAAGDLVEAKAGDALLTLTRAQETELPASAKITFLSAEKDYRMSVAESRRLTGRSGRVAQASLPIVLDDEQASQCADTWLFEAWAAREHASFALAPSGIAIEPGDVLSLTVAGDARTFRVIDITEGSHRVVGALSIDAGLYASSPARTRAATGGGVGSGAGSGGGWVQIGQPVAAFLDLPWLDTTAPPQAGYVACLMDPWPGGVAVYGSPEATGYTLRADTPVAAVMGTTLTALARGPVGRLDQAAALVVKVGGGALTSVSMAQLLAGANAAAIVGPGGGAEVIQFETASLVGPGTYRLSGLLRGQAGSEWAMGQGVGQGVGVAAGATFVVLSDAIARVDLSLGEIRLRYQWQVGPKNRSLGDASFVRLAHTFQGLGLAPLSPVHIRGVRVGGDVGLSWIRRTRQGGDSWDGQDVPLAEESERYEVDILDVNGVVKRTISSVSPQASYPLAAQLADFGAAQAGVAVCVYQMSAIYGRGLPGAATV